MLVVGGRQSSNTAKLRDVCAASCETYLIETADELYALPVAGRQKIGITAGASTPASIIKEVLVTMTDINETNELNFEEMLEESLKSLNTDEKVHGVVVGISPTEVYVDVAESRPVSSRLLSSLRIRAQSRRISSRSATRWIFSS